LFSLELLGRDAHGSLQFSDSALHLKKTRVGCVSVIVEHVHLPVQFDECLLLILVLALDLLCQLVFFVQRGVFALDNVHLKDGARGVFLSLYDFDLALVVLDL